MSVTAFGVRVKEEPGSVAQSSSEGVCYVCSSPGAEYPLNSRPRERGPYFPFLETHIPPLGADRPTSEGIVLACPVCYSFLTQQWEAHEQNGTPRNKRMYWLKRTDNGPYAGMEPSMQAQEESPERGSRQSPVAATAALDLSLPPPSTTPAATAASETCFICGGGTRNGPLANVYAKPIANCPFFPSLASHPLPPGAKPMDAAGRVQACETCHRSLLEQWDSYQRYTVPHSERRYRLPSRAFTCFTCGLEFPVSAQRVVHAAPGPDQQPGFPFLRTVAPPPGAQPLTSAGRALVCSMCYKSLQRQLRVFEISNVPEAKRHFKILHEGTMAASSALAPSPASVLRKQLLSPQTKYLGCYLCEKIGPLESLVTCDTTPSGGPHFPFLRDVARPIAARPMDNQGRVLLCAECRAELQLQWDAFESAGLPLPQRRYHTASLTSPPSTSQNTCFVCAEPMNESFPVGSREGPGPFFPFLESHMGPGTLDSTGTARVCTFCFHSLMAQWLAYESSPHPEDAARAARRYNTHHYVCYICGITTYRRRVRTLTVRDFPFLREHPRPAGALTLRDGVVSCLTCSESLSSQWKDYERMRVPVEMRKYNWIVLPPPPEEARSEGSSPTGQEQGLSDSPGFPPPGGKPPPLQPAATKPGHTSLALSATRTSSFAAALRKLAKQAVDPVLDKEPGPAASIPGGNPRSLTPKRSSSYGLPSPMACGSPPVMSAAPSGLLMEARKALDLGSLSSQHSHRLDHANKMEPSSLSSLDYLSGKHMAGPPGGATGAAHKGAAGNGEDCPRGFQPYRGSAEELRHPVLGTLHPMTPFEPGSYPYHPAPFLPPHLTHPAYRLEDPLYQYNLLRSGPPMVSAPAIPPFYRYPMQQQQQQPPPHQQPPAQQPQPPVPVAPPRTEESKEEPPRLLLLPSAKRAPDSPPSPRGPSHPRGGLEPLRSPPSLLTPLNLATGHSAPPSQPPGPLAAAPQSFADHLGHQAAAEPWRPLANDGPSLHPLQVTKENFQPLPASFAAALAPTAVRQPPPAPLRSSLPLAHSPPTSSASSPNAVRQSPVRHDVTTLEQRQAEQQPPVLSRLDVAERRRKEARARGVADSDSDEDEEWEITLQKPVIWSGPPLRLDLNPKKLQFLNHVGLTSHRKRKELELEQFLRHWTRLHGSEGRLWAAPPLLPLKSVGRSEEEKGGAPAPSEQQQRRPTGPLSPSKNAREPDQQLKRQFLLLLGLSSSGTNDDQEAIWRAIVIERSQRNGAVCRESSFSNPSHRPALTSAGYLQRRALKRQLAASVEMHQNGVCADGPPCRKVPSIQAPQRKPYSKDFGQEFHESGLHHSQQQQEHQLKKRRQRPSYSIFHTRAPPAAAPSPAEESARLGASEDCVQDSAEPAPVPFPWPGVEAVMESYSRYNQERHMEQALLTERERQLRAEQQQLQEEAQRLRLQMAELYQSKKRLDEERQEQQMTIDNLKKCLRLVR